MVLPGQGSFKSCVDALNNINGLTDTANELGLSKATLGYWLLKLQIRVVRVALKPDEEIRVTTKRD